MSKYLSFVNDNLDIKSIVKKYTKSYLLVPWIYEYYQSLSDKKKLLFNKGLCGNPLAITILKNANFKYDYDYLSMNKNPDIIKILQQDKHFKKINWDFLSLNPSAIKILENNKEKINWSELSTNSNAYNLIKNNQEKIDWEELSYYNTNFKIIQLLKNHDEDLYWSALSRLNDDRALLLLQNNKDKIEWEDLSINPHPKAVSLLLNRNNPNKFIDKYNISLNTNKRIISYLQNNTDKIYWENLSRNHNPEAIKFIIKNPDKPKNWSFLSKNPYALNLLKDNKDKIDLIGLGSNPAIFQEYDPLKTLSVRKNAKSLTTKKTTLRKNTVSRNKSI